MAAGPVKSLLSRFKAGRAAAATDDSMLATSLLPPDDAALAATWAQRAVQVQAKTTPSFDAARELLALWGSDSGWIDFGADATSRLAPSLVAAQVASGHELIHQDEAGDFLMVLLDGRVAVERWHVGGDRTLIAEARPGDLLGEMAVVDAGPRFSTCRTLADSRVAVLEAAALKRLMRDDPALAAALLAAISRRLSLRLRQLGARLSALLAPQK